MRSAADDSFEEASSENKLAVVTPPKSSGYLHRARYAALAVLQSEMTLKLSASQLNWMASKALNSLKTCSVRSLGSVGIGVSSRMWEYSRLAPRVVSILRFQSKKVLEFNFGMFDQLLDW